MIRGEPPHTLVRFERLLGADTMSALARWTLHGIRSVLTPDSAFGQYCDRLAAQPVDAQVAALRFLRATRPQRAEILLRRLIARHGTLDPGPAFAGELARLYVAMGRIAAADSIARASTPDLRHGIERLIVTASIVGLAPLADTRDAVHNLDAYVPPDSALLLRHPSRLVDRLDRCAHHASAGDSAIARRWQALFASMPAGGTTLDYRAALVADIDARILQRRDRSAEALVRARDAMRLWGIHTGNTAESQVSPAMRFHLAMLHKAAGQPDSARSLLRSLVPPTTWMGFLTARASFELGVLAEQQGERVAALRHFFVAMDLWTYGDASIESWRRQTAEAIGRLRGREGSGAGPAPR